MKKTTITMLVDKIELDLHEYSAELITKKTVACTTQTLKFSTHTLIGAQQINDLAVFILDKEDVIFVILAKQSEETEKLILLCQKLIQHHLFSHLGISTNKMDNILWKEN